jgi:hypothetical protein
MGFVSRGFASPSLRLGAMHSGRDVFAELSAAKWGSLAP